MAQPGRPILEGIFAAGDFFCSPVVKRKFHAILPGHLYSPKLSVSPHPESCRLAYLQMKIAQFRMLNVPAR